MFHNSYIENIADMNLDPGGSEWDNLLSEGKQFLSPRDIARKLFTTEQGKNIQKYVSSSLEEFIKQAKTMIKKDIQSQYSEEEMNGILGIIYINYRKGYQAIRS